MKLFTFTMGLLCSSTLFAAQDIKQNSAAKVFSLKDVVLENYTWTGDLPAHRKIKIVNHYGNISTRTRSEASVGLSASIQKIGPTPAIPTFDIQETPNQTLITVIYPHGQYNSDNQMIGRVDVAVVVPETVGVVMESTWGTIKTKKHFSNMSAKTVSGNISLGSVGEINAESVSGNISIDHYNINWHNPQKIYTEQGSIKLVLAKLANVNVNASGKSLTSNYYQDNIQSTAEKSVLSFSLNQANSIINLSAPKGSVNIDLIEKPHGGYVGLPTEFNGDIRDLPTVPAWQPGDPIREQNDRRSSKKNQEPQDRGSAKITPIKN